MGNWQTNERHWIDRIDTIQQEKRMKIQYCVRSRMNSVVCLLFVPWTWRVHPWLTPAGSGAVRSGISGGDGNWCNSILIHLFQLFWTYQSIVRSRVHCILRTVAIQEYVRIPDAVICQHRTRWLIYIQIYNHPIGQWCNGVIRRNEHIT